MNKIKKATVNATKLAIAGGVVAPTGVNPAIAAVIGQALMIAADQIAINISEKRTNELFGEEKLVNKVIDEIRESDDFASFVFDLWRRYNFESSEDRRKILKSLLEKATFEEERKYENFSKIFLVAQQITSTELIILNAFYSKEAYMYSDTPTSSNNEEFKLTTSHLHNLFTDRNLDKNALSEIASALTQLGNYGLIAEQPAALGGPYYAPLRFGRVFMGYLED